MRYCRVATMALLLVSMPASACDMPMSTIADYVPGTSTGRVAFVGSILSSTSQASDGVAVEDVIVRVDRVFGPGKLPPTIPVLNRVSGGASPCGNVDLAAKAGEQWLIFAHRDPERLYPDRQLSRKLVNGVVEPSLLRQLIRSK